MRETEGVCGCVYVSRGSLSDTTHQHVELDQILYLQITVNIYFNSLVAPDGQNLDYHDNVIVPEYHMKTARPIKCLSKSHLSPVLTSAAMCGNQSIILLVAAI